MFLGGIERNQWHEIGWLMDPKTMTNIRNKIPTCQTVLYLSPTTKSAKLQKVNIKAN